MALLRLRLLVLALTAGSVFAAPTNVQTPPTVLLDDATIIGQPNGTVVRYLGLPFAQPPFAGRPVPPRGSPSGRTGETGWVDTDTELSYDSSEEGSSSSGTTLTRTRMRDDRRSRKGSSSCLCSADEVQ
ncbi:hypothetical protein OH76DRAFT_1416783 [Lentinus brumalis]|uniref:Carboxylesterase type B domain-containing protein n=1 Tax=Lentinus brumalis TaxID=2498619 RepID=A0A371DI48_9APHY|nr:hypothetical protein OH76DRAFT_1416783 [Polyporus brumalis]